MKVTRFETYRVTIGLGRNPSNKTWSAIFIGQPTFEGVKAHIEHSLKARHKAVRLDTGLPSSRGDCLTLCQCRYLVDTFGLPPNGGALQCVSQGMSPRLPIGHISVDWAEPVIKVG